MKRRPSKLSKSEIKAAADRAEGIPMDSPSPGRGRPTDYDPAYVEQVEKLCLLGATEPEIADFFEVNASTITRWKSKYPDFCAAIKTGKEIADTRVERSLYHRANGYTFESEKIFQSAGEVIRAKTVEHVPPDTAACIFWLKNRRKQDWRDIQQHEHGSPGEFDRMADEELTNMIRQEAVNFVDAGETQH